VNGRGECDTPRAVSREEREQRIAEIEHRHVVAMQSAGVGISEARYTLATNDIPWLLDELASAHRALEDLRNGIGMDSDRGFRTEIAEARSSSPVVRPEEVEQLGDPRAGASTVDQDGPPLSANTPLAASRADAPADSPPTTGVRFGPCSADGHYFRHGEMRCECGAVWNLPNHAPSDPAGAPAGPETTE
jgi:hypothetical protein